MNALLNEASDGQTVPQQTANSTGKGHMMGAPSAAWPAVEPAERIGEG